MHPKRVCYCNCELDARVHIETDLFCQLLQAIPFGANCQGRLDQFFYVAGGGGGSGGLLLEGINFAV